MKSIFWSNTLLFKFCKLISRNIFKQVWILVFVHHSLVRKMKKLLSRKKFCQINDLVISLVKPLLSRNFCQKIIRENCRNFHTACIICTFYKEMEIKIVKSIWRIWNLLRWVYFTELFLQENYNTAQHYIVLCVLKNNTYTVIKNSSNQNKALYVNHLARK